MEASTDDFTMFTIWSQGSFTRKTRWVVAIRDKKLPRAVYKNAMRPVQLGLERIGTAATQT